MVDDLKQQIADEVVFAFTRKGKIRQLADEAADRIVALVLDRITKEGTGR